MKKHNSNRHYRWISLPVVLCSMASLAGQVHAAGQQVAGQQVAGQQISGQSLGGQSLGGQSLFGGQSAAGGQQVFAGGQQGFGQQTAGGNAQDARQVGSVNHQYVGGKTRIGVSVTDDGNASADIDHVIMEGKDSSTSVGLWAGFDLEGDEKGVDSGGAALHHNWVSRDGQGNARRVNKAFVAYDRNVDEHEKVTVGYGQEHQDMFWEGHVSKALSDRKLVSSEGETGLYEQAYSNGVGASVGTFIPRANMRVRGGLDYQWSDEVGSDEDTASLTTVSAGLDKFFEGTPHSIGLDVAASRRSGGFETADSGDTETTASLSYNYEFGGGNIYQPDQRYRRVRVEVPGQDRPATYAKKPVYKKQPIYKKQAIYEQKPVYKNVPKYDSKSVRVPFKNVVKSKVELEGQTFFKFGSAKLIPSAKQRLDQIAAEIHRHGYKGNIRVTGHSCGLSDPGKDQALSQKRADVVKHYLSTKGIRAEHMVAKGLGHSVGKGHASAQDFQNRRVDIEFVTEREQVQSGVRTQNRIQTGTSRVISGYKRVKVGEKNVQVGVRNVQTGTEDILVTKAVPGTPRVIWRTERIAGDSAWVRRALRNTIDHDRTIDTFFTRGDAGVTVTDDNNTENRAPLASADDQETTVNKGNFEGTVLIDVMLNDGDLDGDTLTIESVSAGTQGGTTKIEDGQIIFTPAVDFVGTDTFTYVISDGNGGTDEATVTVVISDTGGTVPDITVPDVNDCDCLKANDDTGIDVLMGSGANTIDVLANDTGTGRSVTSVSHGANGMVSVGSDGQSVIYTPTPGFMGEDRFWYEITGDNGKTFAAEVVLNVK